MVERDSQPTLLRRRLLVLTAAGSLAAVSGCLGDDEDVPDPVALDEGQVCDQCNMQIANHPGPVGQAYYLDDPPEDLPDDRTDGLAHFCSSQCTYRYVRQAESQSTEPAGIYVTDYTDLDYELSGDAGATVISSHLDADTFARAETLTYVVDSDIEGSMGPSLIGFSDSGDAESFQNEHGGMILDHDDITLEAIGSL